MKTTLTRNSFMKLFLSHNPSHPVGGSCAPDSRSKTSQHKAP